MTDIVEIKNFLSSDECNKLIQIHSKLFTFRGKFYNKTEVLNVMHMLSSDDEDDVFIKYIHGKLTDHIKTIGRNNFINFFEIVKWKKGLSMPKHLDEPYDSWTSVIYLNDDYNGGETVVDNKKITPQKGKIVTFQGVSLVHGVNEILEGYRYTVPVWYRSA